MTQGPLYRPGHDREPRPRTAPLKPVTTIDTPRPTEDDMGHAKGPHRRHAHGVCPTCSTEFKVEDKRATEAPCPECETLVPIVRPPSTARSSG